jgi:uncharacterized membrane protein YjjB (DUF3815 family)
MVLKLAAVFVMGTAVGVLYRIPRRALLYGALTAAFGWVVTVLLVSAGTNAVAANFFGSVALGAASEALARLLRTPAIVFVIPGFFPLVPGGGLYDDAFSGGGAVRPGSGDGGRDDADGGGRSLSVFS